MSVRLVQFDQVGGPEVLQVRSVELPPLKDNEVLVAHKFIGINYVDTYIRNGLYPTKLPSSLGREASGVVEKVGALVTDSKIGDRVAYALGNLGSYSEKRNINADDLVQIPERVSLESAAALLLKGLTVHYLFKGVRELKKDETILFHAAAGGVGLIACQWAQHIGAHLIGTTSSKSKADLALKNGASVIINYTVEDVPQRILEITKGLKVPVVYDSVGRSTFEMSLDSLQKRGLLVSFGNASGPVTGVDLGILAQKGGLFVTRPTLNNYMDTKEKYREAAAELFDLVSQGIIKENIDKVLPLSEVVTAHRLLEDRTREGTLLLKI